ncbi:hypothetical protein [Nitratifractor sp.]|uniref:hypothetical protein n=1 Tax=Nitratifractor sp. TaxID=2268144 RepID=UPI0025E43ED5|nr:hypothetical protein [Nitratifractor sp.]
MRWRVAFTLIEVLVSVVLISVVVVGILKIREQNIDAAQYLSSRMGEEMANSLFLGPESLRYNGEKKDAYTLLKRLGVSNDKSRDILKKMSRQIRISDPLPIGDLPLPIQLKAIRLEGKYPSRYYRILY